MLGSVSDFCEKMANARRWRSGEDGAVNSNTAGPVKATLRWNKNEREVRASGSHLIYLIPCGIMGWSTAYPSCLYLGPFLFRPEIYGTRCYHRCYKAEEDSYWITHSVTEMDPCIAEANPCET